MSQARLFALLWLALAGMVVLHTQLVPQPFPFTNIDEHAHYSYTLELIHRHHWWPNFDNFPMYDAATKLPTTDLNYVNHPPMFYWLMKLVQQAFPDINPQYYRLVPLIFYLAAIGIYARVGTLLKLPLFATIIYASLPILLYLPLQSGYYNNDSMAMAGGALACLGSFHILSPPTYKRGLYYLAGGLVLASVKLTAFLLVGLYALCFLWSQRHTVPRVTLLRVGELLALLSSPYLALTARYGSPAPNTSGQIDWVIYYSKLRGWYDAPRLDFISWLLRSLDDFANQFASREATFLPLLMLIAAFASLLLPRRSSEPAWFRPMATAACLSTVAVLAMHLGFSWPRHVKYGWIYDMFIRYYFPLLPAYGAVIAGAYLRFSGPAKQEGSSHAA